MFVDPNTSTSRTARNSLIWSDFTGSSLDFSDFGVISDEMVSWIFGHSGMDDAMKLDQSMPKHSISSLQSCSIVDAIFSNVYDYGWFVHTGKSNKANLFCGLSKA